MPLSLAVLIRTRLERVLMAVFLLESLVNLAANLFCPGESWLVFPSKVLLMPTLAALLYVRTRGQSPVLSLPPVFIALGLSWVGDIVLGVPAREPELLKALFLAGMAAFGLSHVFFTLAILHGVDPKRLNLTRTLFSGLLFVVYGYTLYSLIYINMHEGDMTLLRVSVLIYMVLLLSTAASSVLRQFQFDSPSAFAILVGALLLVQSDSILAITHFVEPLPIEDFAVMATYLLGQFLIVKGCAPGQAPLAAVPARLSPTIPTA